MGYIGVIYPCITRTRCVFECEGDLQPQIQRVQVPNNWVLGFWVIVIIVQVLGKYMIFRYLDPLGK